MITDEKCITIPFYDMIKFVDWVSNEGVVRCANGEWIKTGTGDYKTVAINTNELYKLFKVN